MLIHTAIATYGAFWGGGERTVESPSKMAVIACLNVEIGSWGGLNIRSISQSIIFILLSLLCLDGAAFADNNMANDRGASATKAGVGKTPVETTQAVSPLVLQDNWLDMGRRYVTNSTGAVADWIDRFFGAERSDVESAYTAIRLTDGHIWDARTGWTSDTHVRGNVRLPRINHRLSLVFSQEKEDVLGGFQPSSSSVPAENNNDTQGTSGALQYKIKEVGHYRLDFRLGLRSTGKLKTGVRYRYELPINEKVVDRLTETVEFVDGQGYSFDVVVDQDRLIFGDRLVRWSTRAKVGDAFDGVVWSSSLNYADQLSNRAALTHFAWVSGVTQPEALTTSYGIGSRYRRSFYRSWLYFEVGPSYAWIWDGVAGERKGRWQFVFKLEALLERDSHDR